MLEGMEGGEEARYCCGVTHTNTLSHFERLAPTVPMRAVHA